MLAPQERGFVARNTKPRSSGTPLTARLHSLAGFRSFDSTPQRTWPDRLPFTFVVRLRRRCSVYMQSEQLWPATSQPTRSVPNYRRATSHQRPEKRHRDREKSVFSFAGDEYVTARRRRQYRTFSEADGLDFKTAQRNAIGSGAIKECSSSGEEKKSARSEQLLQPGALTTSRS